MEQLRKIGARTLDEFFPQHVIPVMWEEDGGARSGSAIITIGDWCVVHDEMRGVHRTLLRGKVFEVVPRSQWPEQYRG